MTLLSVIIPSRNEEFLAKTVEDIFEKARGDIEVIAICDENPQPLKPRKNLHVIQKVGPPGLRTAIHQGINAAKGKFIMKLDGHCMLGEGFDTILTSEIEDNWIVIPRRYSLVVDEWKINTGRPIIDYEYLCFPYAKELSSVKTGGKWYQRALDRKEMLIDEEMAFQGSCWITHKKWFKDIDGFSEKTATGDQFVLESEEMANKTWFSGGKVMVNKKTWYAHLHKGARGRGYFINKWPMRRQRVFHIDYWMHDRYPNAIHKMEWFIEKFWPVPGWPEDWQDPKWEKQYLERLNKGQYPAEGP